MIAESPGADVRSLVGELTALGVRAEQDLLVHCSLHQVGPVRHGAATVLAALRRAAGEGATIVVPTHTAGNSMSSRSFLAATAGLSAAARDDYVAAMPGFDAAVSPSAGMGRLAEYVRTSPGARRSGHPQTSFAALGPCAAECTDNHALCSHLGERSPLGWLYRAGAAVLLLGVGYAACSVFHLAEYRLPEPRRRSYRCFVMTDGKRQEYKFRAVDCVDGDFEELGEVLDNELFVRRGQVGVADCRLLSARDAVDFAVAWPPFRRKRAAA
jgi:aminoglycoside 3-N-acetyltransferase